MRAAFAESATLTRGLRWKLTGVLVGVVLVSLALGLVASLLGDACTSVVLGVLGSGAASLAISFGALLLLRTHHRRRLHIPGFLRGCGRLHVALSAAPCRAWRPGIASGRSRARLTGRPTALAACGPARRPAGFRCDRRLAGPRCDPGASGPITIHAHRGVTTKAPENTLAAAREAIAAGADYLETDVQLSKDDVLVVVHDSDFSRLGGVAKKVWDLTYDEIRAIPLGGGRPEFPEFTPTFDALLAETKGRIKVEHRTEILRRSSARPRPQGR